MMQPTFLAGTTSLQVPEYSSPGMIFSSPKQQLALDLSIEMRIFLFNIPHRMWFLSADFCHYRALVSGETNFQPFRQQARGFHKPHTATVSFFNNTIHSRCLSSRYSWKKNTFTKQ
ncbi:hypothetical protein Droror1_Dr00000407 [Drosera rotundifolia]